MRTFKEIYSELKHYSAFKAEPSTEAEAITSTNAFFAEVALDDDANSTARFASLVKCHINSASEYFRNKQVENLSFKHFLQNLHEVAKQPFLIIDTPKGEYSCVTSVVNDDWQKNLVDSFGDRDVTLSMQALYEQGRVIVDSSDGNSVLKQITFKGHRIGVDGILSSLPIVRTTKSLMNNDKKMAEGTLHQDIKAQHYPNMKQRNSS